MVYRYQVATVFGGSGFIGRHIIRRLAKTGCVIRVPSRHPGRLTSLKPMGAVGQIVPLAVNLKDDASLDYAVRGADLVINLIGILAPQGRHDTFANVHGDLPGRIAKAAKAAGVERFVQMSSLGADPDAVAEYARTKGHGEQAVLAAFPEATIFRPSIVFGPEDGFFNRFAAMAQLLPFLPLIGGGHTKFQPVYVGDVAEAVMSALATTESKGRVYELGGPRVYSFRQLMDLVKRETMRPKKRLVEIPWGLARLQGAVFEKLPGKIITQDQVELLRVDNVVSGKHPGLAELGVTPTTAEVIVPTYLDKFRVGGRFTSPGTGAPGTGKRDAAA